MRMNIAAAPCVLGAAWTFFTFTQTASADYAREVRQDAPASWWRFHDTESQDGASARDELDQHPGVYRGQVDLGEGPPGTGGRAARFDGANSCVEIPDHPALALRTLSVEFWFKSTQRWEHVNWPGDATFVSKATTGPSSRDWTVIADSRRAGTNLGRVHVFSGAAGTASDGQLVSGGGLNDGRWHHVVWTRTSHGANKLFVDGRLTDLAEDGGGAITNQRPIQIGGDPFERGASLAGWMAEVAIYATALSPERIGAHFQAGLPSAANASSEPAFAEALERLVLTNRAGLRWELLRTAQGWTLGGVSLHERPVEAPNRAGLMLLRHLDTATERWVAAASAQRLTPHSARCSGQTEIDGARLRFEVDLALDEQLPAVCLTPHWSVDRELRGWEICLAYHDQFAHSWRVQSYPWAGDSAQAAISPLRYCGVPAALVYRPDLSMIVLWAIDCRFDYLNPTTWTGQTGFHFKDGLLPAQFRAGGGTLSPGVVYTHPLQLFFSDAGESARAITELVRGWMQVNEYRIDPLPLARSLDDALGLYLQGRRTSRVWIEGIGYEHGVFPDGRGYGFAHLCNLAYSAYLEYRLYELTGDPLWRDRAFTQMTTLLKAQQSDPAQPHFGAIHDNYQIRDDRGLKAGTFHSRDWAQDGYKVDVMAQVVRYMLLTWQRLKAHEKRDRKDWYQAAVRCAEWILRQQNDDGGLPQTVDIPTGRRSISVVSHRALPALPFIAQVTGDPRFWRLSQDLERFLRDKVEGRFWFTGAHPDLPPNDFEQDSVWGAVEYWLDKHDRTGEPEALRRAVADVYYVLLYWCPKQLSWVKRPTQCAHSEQQHFNQYSVYCFQNRKVECLDRLARKTGDRLFADLRDRVIALNVFTQVTKPGDWLGGFSEAIADPWLERGGGFEWVGSTYTSELCTDFFMQLVELGLAKPRR